VTYSQSSSWCVTQFMLPLFCIFGKLLGNILDIRGHDVKPCDQYLPSSQYSACIVMNFASICVVQNVAKIHARCMWFKFCFVTFINVLVYFWYCSFMSINVWWWCSMSSTKFKCSFFTSMAFTSVSCNASCWVVASYSSPRLFIWHAINSSCNALCFDVTSQSCIYITPISPHNASKACSTMLTHLVEDNMLASCANHPWPFIVSNGM
jgi:hypothetical protein